RGGGFYQRAQSLVRSRQTTMLTSKQDQRLRDGSNIRERFGAPHLPTVGDLRSKYGDDGDADNDHCARSQSHDERDSLDVAPGHLGLTPALSRAGHNARLQLLRTSPWPAAAAAAC